MANKTNQPEQAAPDAPYNIEGGYGGQGLVNLFGQLKNTVPQAPSTQTDIDHVLASYMDELTNLGPEYGEEMAYLAPYLSATNTGGLTQQGPAYTGPGAATVNSTNAALQSADESLGTASENMPPPGFGAAAQAGKEFENTLPYQQAITAGLGYQKYLETYGGLQPPTSQWPEQLQNIYKLITGSSGTTGGLPGVTSAAAAGNANALLNTAGSGSAPGTSNG